MSEIFIVLPLFTFIYLIIMEIIKNNNAKKILKIYAENGLLNTESCLNHNINLNLKDHSENKSIILPLSLGLMGFSLGMFFVFILKHAFAEYNYSLRIFQSIDISLPIFFGALGLLVSYMIERKSSK